MEKVLIRASEVSTASYELSYICQNIWPKLELHEAISLTVFFRHELQPKQKCRYKKENKVVEYDF